MRKTFTLVTAVLATSAFAAIDTLPESAQVQTWYFNAEKFYPTEMIINQEIQVALDGNDLYFTGLSSDFAHVWAKGTLENGLYVFAQDQDMGMLWGSPISFGGYDFDNWMPIVATAQMVDNVLTFNTAIGFYYNSYTENTAYGLGWVIGATMSAEPVEYVEPILNENTASVPYKNGFDSEAKRNQVSFEPNDETGWMWGADWNTNNWYATCNNDGWEQANDYMVFPGLALEAGKNYVLNFDAQTSANGYWQYYEVLIGDEAKLSKLTAKLIENSYCYSTDWENVEREFAVAESGTYFIAIHSTSYAYSGFFNVDNFSVEEVDAEKPAAAEGVYVTPGRNGALAATISFTMPSANIGGNTYASDKVLTYKVTRDEFIIGEGSAKAGELVFVTDDGMGLKSGFATYKVVVADDTHVSKEASATAYIGIDYPTETEYIEITTEGNLVTIAWAPVTKGANGGYVGAKYNVYKCSAKYQKSDAEKLNEEPLSDCFFTFEMDVNAGEQGEAWFCVTAVNDLDESYGAYESLAVGAPYELPFTESFAVADAHVWSFGGEGGSAYVDRWGSFSSDGDDASLCLYIWGWDNETNYAYATTGKISTAANAKLSFDYMAQANTTLAILLDNGDPEGLTVVGEYEIAAGTTDSLVIENVFADVVGCSYAKVMFAVQISDSYQYFFFDNLKIAVDTPTGIDAISNEKNVQFYNLNGQRLNARPAAGLFFQNGKKMMVK